MVSCSLYATNPFAFFLAKKVFVFLRLKKLFVFFLKIKNIFVFFVRLKKLWPSY